MFNNKILLVTGGTGSFGRQLVKHISLNYKPKKLIIYSRDELKQFEMQQEFSQDKHPWIRYFIGDVRDLSRLIRATEDADYLIHAAALKQVPAAEYNPFEAIKTNVIGAQNIIDASIHNKIKKIIALSTDKAAAPINLYGATKLCADKLFISANNYTGDKDIKFSVVRYGNVMGSRGSVIPFFREKSKTGTLPITDKNMTRFNITIQDGVKFVIRCLDKMWGGELFIPKMPSYRVLDVAAAINPNAKLNYIGIRPGEKIHEELFTSSDSHRTIEFKDYFVVLPSFEPNWNVDSFIKKSDKIKGSFVKSQVSYDSGNNKKFLSVNEIKKLLADNNL